MKWLLVFASLMAAAASYPVVRSWTLDDLIDVVKNNKGDPAMKEHYNNALNGLYAALFSNQVVYGSVISPSGNPKWTEDELIAAIMDPNISTQKRDNFVTFLRAMHENEEYNKLKSIPMIVPALDISIWPVAEVKEAIENPDTKPALLPYLEKAKEDIKKAVEAGTPLNYVIVISPVGLVPTKSDYKPTIVPATIEKH